MNKVRIGVLCPSEIAFRRFMPSLKKINNAQFVGIAIANSNEWFDGSDNFSTLNQEKIKAEKFISEHGGKIFNGYNTILTSDEIDAIYIPLPPALHYMWGNVALKNNKHVFLEKPFTISLNNTLELIEYADKNNLALHENYMFTFHSQLEYIKTQINRGIIGDIRLYRIDFSFPFRGSADFRYNKELGGGALFDCGGYTVKLASILLGKSLNVLYSKLNYNNDYSVDIYGNATLQNKDGIVAQLSFGMDNNYKCSLEVSGSKGSIFTNRIFTAPIDYEPIVKITGEAGNNEKNILLPCDDSFKKSIEYFLHLISNDESKKKSYENIRQQSMIIEKMLNNTLD